MARDIKKSPLTNKVLDKNILNSNIAVRKMLTTLTESTPPEVETINTQEVINLKEIIARVVSYLVDKIRLYRNYE